MKKSKMTLLATLLLCGTVTFSSCIGSFQLSNNLLAWNKTVGSKFVNELVFFGFSCILPVYGATMLVDVLALNTIEFWSGSNPVASNDVRMIQGEHGNFLVQRTKNGYQVTNADTKEVVLLSFDEASQSWFYEVNGEAVKFMSFKDENNVTMYLPGGQSVDVELSEAGVIAFQQFVEAADVPMFAVR
jgi:hypothetical protein